MRLPLFAAAALCVSNLAAYADTYTINYQPFAAYGFTEGVSGSFNYNGSTFSNFVVNSQGYSFDFTTMANQGFGPAGSPMAGCQTGTTFHFLSATGACTPYLEIGQNVFNGVVTGVYADFDIPDPNGGSYKGIYGSHTVAEINLIDPLNNFKGTYGSFGITDVSSSPAPAATTPEPSSFALLGTGLLGALGAVRKRFVMR